MIKFGKEIPETVTDIPNEYPNLYIHVPFCRRKCGYCAFYSAVGEMASREMQERWLEKTAVDLGRYRFSKPLDTLFIGGGTPTYIDSGILFKFVSLCRKMLYIDENTEITMEANPDTIDEEKLDIITGFVNRISLGVQSFSAVKREKLHRMCSDGNIAYAISECRKRFKHMNIDLIYGLQGETLDDWRSDLDMAVAAGCDHVSCYELTPEDKAGIKYEIFSNDDAADFWLFTGKHLAEHGIFRYEVSNYSRSGCRCRHNMNVWNGDLLCGIGPAAAGFNGLNRWGEKPDLNDWLLHLPPAVDILAGKERYVELITVGLRRTDGWSRKEVRERFGSDLEEQLCKLKEKFPCYFCSDGERISFNEDGLMLWDGMVLIFCDMIERAGIC